MSTAWDLAISKWSQAGPAEPFYFYLQLCPLVHYQHPHAIRCRKPEFVECDHHAVANSAADETPANLVWSRVMRTSSVGRILWVHTLNASITWSVAGRASVLVPQTR
jgi:hypothetical protein